MKDNEDYKELDQKKGCITAAVCWIVIIVIVILMEVL